MPDAPLLEVERIIQEFPAASGKPNRVLHEVTFKADRAGTICVLGPSGCGKSTILRMISGMYDRRARMPTSGTVRIRGQVVDGPQEEVLTVFQRPVLKAWLNVRDNVALPFRAGLWGDRVPESQQKQRVSEILEAVGMTAAARLYPRQLSGGMQQRVSLAARLVLRPSILCLDEPFSALDPQTRQDMQDLVLRMWNDFPCLALFVTHDITEALRLADRILVMSTRPATVVADLPVTAGKPRPDAWLRSPECQDLERRIISLMREANGNRHGTLTMAV
jgi:ABC-type nitrate/sulfonate/bicarbonate transport system ATPase subunit